MLDDFMTRATLAGIGVSLAAAPLGCFVVWRRMAYFGEATAHAAMLGVAISLTFEFSILAGAILVSLIMTSNGLPEGFVGVKVILEIVFLLLVNV